MYVHLIRFDHHFIRFFNMLHLLALVFSLAAAAIAAPTTLTARAGRTSPPSGCLSVGGSGTYKTVSAAVAKLSTSSTSAQCIFIYKGM
jgi:pectinesterase